MAASTTSSQPERPSTVASGSGASSATRTAPSTWRPAIRMARRDAARHRGKSVLVLVMIALPVLGVTAADVVIQTQEVSGSEAMERRLGTADALVSFSGDDIRVYHGADPDSGNYASDCCRREGDPRPSVGMINEALGRQVRAR